MLVDPNDPTRLFTHALQGLFPTPAQIATLDPAWQDAIQAAQDASPHRRRAALVLARAGFTNVDALVNILRLPDPSAERPWPEPTPFGRPTLPHFPDRVLPHWLGNYVRSEARATQTPVDLPAMLALAVLSTALAGRVALNLYTLVALPPGHHKSAVFSTVTAPLHEYEAEAARAAAPLLAVARRGQHAAERALLRVQDKAALVPDDDPRRPQLLHDVRQRLEELAACETPITPRQPALRNEGPTTSPPSASPCSSTSTAVDSPSSPPRAASSTSSPAATPRPAPPTSTTSSKATPATRSLS